MAVAEEEEAKSPPRIPEQDGSSTDGGVLVEEEQDFFANQFSPTSMGEKGGCLPLATSK